MASLDHWHPVLLSKQLKHKPVGVRVCGKELVLFRPGPGQVGALNDCCVHRRMRLSLGAVDGGRLRCKYHGWTYTADGQGESPATPKMLAQTEAFDAQEKFGLVWVKPRPAEAAFPHFDVDGWYHLCTLWHHAPAPLETTVDNFCEIEHTPTVHAVFGYALERMHEVQVHFETTPTSVRVLNHGPPKPLSPFLRYLIGIGPGYQFNDDWTTFFSPVYSVYNHWWSCPKTGKESWVRWRLYIIFTPLDDHNTAVSTVAFTKSTWPGPYGGVRLAKWFFARQLSREVWLDTQILAGLADKRPDIEGLKLSRFDRVLGLNRERIDRVYRGITPGVSYDSAGQQPSNLLNEKVL
jgi:phenylpropionate dioxygenase-like ring-hydroxylating dioxygenase large terminal subunit